MDGDANGTAPPELSEDWNMASADGPAEPSEPRESLPPAPDNLTVGYVYEPQMMLHSDENTSSAGDHPEQPARIRYIYDLFHQHKCLVRMRKLKIRKAEKEEVLLVHSEALWEHVMQLRDMSPEKFTLSESFYEADSLYVHPMTPLSARLSCGGVIEATLAVARGELLKTFAIVRPPGHHAEPNRPMGFCFFNNVSVAIKVMQNLTPIKKVLILDWDVHHGNGTQKAFNEDPNVLYISLHRYEGGRFYPSGPFGSMVSSGEGPGLGFSVNIPWPEKGTGDADYIHAFQRIVMPIAIEFNPEIVIISAGFDAAEGDHLGECKVTPAGYAHMTHMLSGLAGGRVVVALEGGYNLEATSTSALSVGRTLLGEAPPELGPLIASEAASEAVWQVAVHQSKYWHNLDPKACEPKDEFEDNTFSIPEILKEHRQAYMYQKHNMLEVPFLYEEQQDRFSQQIMCTKEIFDKDVLVIFAHGFGDLRVEIANTLECNVHMEHSYLIDASRKLVEWITSEKYALLDINILPRPVPANRAYEKRKPQEYTRDLMTYLWDNYVVITNAKHIVLIGHGPGVLALRELMDARMAAIMRRVSLVVQVVGHADVPLLPKKDPDAIKWYHKNSLVIVPSRHYLRAKGNPQEVVWRKRHGAICEIDEEKAIKLLTKALPVIRQTVRNAVGQQG